MDQVIEQTVNEIMELLKAKGLTNEEALDTLFKCQSQHHRIMQAQKFG